MTKKQPIGRWFCSNFDDNFYTDEESKSVEHQSSHALADAQIKCMHDKPCESAYVHLEKSCQHDPRCQTMLEHASR